MKHVLWKMSAAMFLSLLIQKHNLHVITDYKTDAPLSVTLPFKSWDLKVKKNHLIIPLQRDCKVCVHSGEILLEPLTINPVCRQLWPVLLGRVFFYRKADSWTWSRPTTNLAGRGKVIPLANSGELHVRLSDVDFTFKHTHNLYMCPSFTSSS